ncbi:hypothetical protein QQZ08_001309 [Neonectria magnoliae]|uniref:Hypervirulence associated protein TUDOR domain-containing protein n=1 Tax=Neonectria magnoliae TaxID=2732573 RepID=A0ABR1IG98_9HYPO
MKGRDQVVDEFNSLVNMTAAELEKWLKSDDSNSAGWPKEDDNRETVGHDSGRKIVDILKANPDKDPEAYTEDQVAHMRKVVAYCKRHLAQEAAGNSEKSPAEVKKTKSYASLKNWGHDFLKAENHGMVQNDEDEDTGEGESHIGEKRKTSQGQQGSTKKRETRKGKGQAAGDEEEEEEEEKDEDGDYADEDVEEVGRDEETLVEENDEAEEGDGEVDEHHDDDDDNEAKRKGSKTQTNGKNKQGTKQKGANSGDKSGSKTANGPEKGETVSWNWGSGQPEGEVLDVRPEDTSITTKKGNQVSRKGTKEDPAVVLDTGKSKAIKLSHELN